MSILNPIPAEQLGTRFKHRGWMLFCPIYIGGLQDESPLVAERNGVPEILLDLAHWVMAAIIWLLCVVNWRYEPSFMLVVTDEISPPLDAT